MNLLSVEEFCAFLSLFFSFIQDFSLLFTVCMSIFVCLFDQGNKMDRMLAMKISFISRISVIRHKLRNFSQQPIKPRKKNHTKHKNICFITIKYELKSRNTLEYVFGTRMWNESQRMSIKKQTKRMRQTGEIKQQKSLNLTHK